METEIGVWIDSRTAVIVRVETGGISRVTTDPEKELRLPAGARALTSHGKQVAPPDDMRETSSQANLQAFFGGVIADIKGAHALFVFGPGEAKEEFHKRLTREGLGGLIKKVETAGRMTDRQVAAKVREHFRSDWDLRRRMAGVL